MTTSSELRLFTETLQQNNNLLAEEEAKFLPHAQPHKETQDKFLLPPQHHTPDSVLQLLSSVLPLLSGPRDLQLQPVALAQLISLSVGLRQVGHLLEKNHGDSLDCLHLQLINVCQDPSVDVLLRLQLLEIIELRTLGWQSVPLIDAYYQKRFGDYDRNHKAKDSFAKDVDLILGNSVGNLLEGRGSVGNLATGAMCEEGGAVEFAVPRGKSGDSADLVQDKMKPVLANDQSNESAVGESCSSINNGSTVDSESFHTVCNSNSSSQVEEEVSKGVSSPPSGSVRVCDEEVESFEDQAQGEDDRDPALEICTLEACGVVLTIQSANLAAAHKTRDALKEFMTKGRHDVASKVLRRSREEILRLAASPFSQLPPQQWDTLAPSLPLAVVSRRKEKSVKKMESGFTSFRRVPAGNMKSAEPPTVPMEVRKEIGCTIITRLRLEPTPPVELPVKSKAGKKHKPRGKRRPRNITI